MGTSLKNLHLPRGAEQKFGKGFQKTLRCTYPFSRIENHGLKDLSALWGKRPDLVLLGSWKAGLFTAPGGPTYAHSSTFSQSLRKKRKSDLSTFTAASGLWCPHANRLLGMHVPYGAQHPGCLCSHSAGTAVSPPGMPCQYVLWCFQGTQMMSRPKSRRDYSQRSFWSLMSWNIFYFKFVILSTHCDLMTLFGISVCGWGLRVEECVFNFFHPITSVSS